ncbi:MAG: LamG domain-containing protein [Ekhidna sp.]
MKSRILSILFLSALTGLFPIKINAQNYALAFDGVDDKISVSTLGTSSNFTYEMWVYFPSDPGGFVTLLDFSNDNPWVGIANGIFALWDGGTQGSGLLLQKDRWKHLAITYASNTIKFYIDGELKKTITKTLSNSVTGMTIGFSTGDGYYEGRMDELRIWNTERSITDITDNMFSSLLGTETGLVAYYNFDEGTGSTLTDLTSNSHNGTLTNFPTNPWVDGAPVDRNTWDGAVWSDGTPSSGDDVIFEDDYDFSSSGLEVNAAFIHSDVDITVNDKYFKVNGDLQTNGSLTISSGASLVTSGNQLVLGDDISFLRTTTHSVSTGKYSIVGMPVKSGNRDEFGDVVYEYNETEVYNSTTDNPSSGNNGLDRFSLVSSGESLAVGSGYFSAFTGDVSFLGLPNAGSIDVSVTYTDHDVAGTSDEENYEGFNLISNPYPAPITLSSFIAANTSQIEGTIYLWDDGGSESERRTDSDYILANTMGASGGSGGATDWDGNIRSFQGFFVQAKSAGTVSFTDAMKSTGINDADAFYRVEEKYQLLRLSLHDNEISSECLLGTAKDATINYDQLYDSFKPFSLGALSIYSLLENRTMGIQGIPTTLEESIQLGVQIDQEGIYSIEAIDNSLDRTVILIDHYKEQTFDLSLGDYSFSSKAGRFDNRFEIVFSNSPLSLESREFLLYQQNSQLVINNKSGSSTNFTLLTIAGRKVVSGNLSLGESKINIPNEEILILEIENRRPIKFYTK